MTTNCECGAPAAADSEGYAFAIYNGMYNLEVCDACWRDPENIATEVTVKVASDAVRDGLPYNVAWLDLSPDLVRSAVGHLVASLAARGIGADDVDAFNEAMVVISDRWNEWYAAG